MKKLHYYRYGGASTMRLEDVAIPRPKPDELLIKVNAASVNPIDFKLRMGIALFMPNFGFPKGMGIDFSGTVVEVGTRVQGFQLDDEVFGWVDYAVSNTFAEYAIVKAKLTVKKSNEISFIEAAALPMVACTALNALVWQGRIKENQRILINGCTGGVGHVAVQIAKAYGAEVIGTCSAANMEIATSLGVDEVVDYREPKALTQLAPFDCVLDTPGKFHFLAAQAFMKSRSIYLAINPHPEALLGYLGNPFRSKKYALIMAKGRASLLQQIQALVAGQQLKALVGKVFPFSEAIEAVKFLEQGNKVTGKVVMVMD